MKVDIPIQYIPIVGSVTAALIAGTVAYMVSVLSKEHKTSEFRQAWIDNLRADVSEFLGHTTSVINNINIRLKLQQTNEELIAYALSKESDLIKINSLVLRIKLRLNPKEHNNMISLLQTAEHVASNYSEDFQTEWRSVSSDIVDETQKILKREWDRVKSGERIFVVTKWVSGLVLIFSILFLIFYFFTDLIFCNFHWN